jgi:hypothetical protein
MVLFHCSSSGQERGHELQSPGEKYNAYEVKELSPHHRFVIALHSPGGVAETGLRVCPPEKNARKLARDVRRATFSGAV